MSQLAIDSKVAELNKVEAERQQRRSERTPPPVAPTRSLVDLSSKGGSKSAPRDNTRQRTDQVLAQVDAAERQVLQALLSLATSTEARAALQKKIAEKDAEAEVSRLDKQIADVQADKGVSAAKKRELVAQLEVAKGKAAEAAQLKQQQIDRETADQVAREQLALTEQGLDAEAELLQLQADLSLSERERAAISLRLVDIAYQKEKAELEGVIASKTAADADKELARRKLATLNAAQPGRVEQAQRNASEPQRQVGQIVQGIRKQGNLLEDTRAMYAEIERLRQQDAISEAEAAQAKAEVNARYQEARLQGASTFFGNLATLSESSNKTLAAIGKAAAIAQATIDGVLAVQKALASAPPPFNFALAAAVGVSAAVNVAKIAGLKDGGEVTGPGGPRDDKVLRWLSNGEHVVNARAAGRPGVRPLLDYINAGGDLRGMLPQPQLPANRAPLAAAAPGGGDIHVNPIWHISNPDPSLERLISRQPRVFVRAIQQMVRNGDLKAPPR